MQGGAVQGVGWALYEEMRYDDDGQLLSGSWMDYAMPDAVQASPIQTQIVEVPSISGPLWRARRGRAAGDPDSGGDCQCGRACHWRAHDADADDGATRVGGAGAAVGCFASIAGRATW